MGAEEGRAPVFVGGLLIVESGFTGAGAANLGKLRGRSGYGEGGRVVSGVGSYRVLLKFRNRVLAIGGFLLKMGNIGIGPVHQAAGARTASLQAGADMEDDHQVAAQGFGLLGLADAKAFSGGDHQDDRDHSPGDSEHGQQGADSVRPKGSKDVLDEIAK